MRHFSLDEFDSPDLQGSGHKMNTDFLRKLDTARSMANIPFIITSGFRTEEHNKLVGGVVGSSHTKGLAADIAFTTKAEAVRIIWALTKAGINRIGLGDNFIHADDDKTKPTPAFWGYE